MGRNPKTGEPAAIDPRRVISFRASQVMKARVDARRSAERRTLAVAKGPDAFRTISEAADELGVPQHVLRFWETKFSFIRPMKRAGGRRFYRPQDIAVLHGVRRLLHDEGYTIKGVQRLHKEQGVRRLLAADGEPRTGRRADGRRRRGRRPRRADRREPRRARSRLAARCSPIWKRAKRRLDAAAGAEAADADFPFAAARAPRL